MKIAAIIAEYNPFHNGHAWQAEALRSMGVSHIVAVMSPDYTQRGAPAILDKRTRTRAALLGGIDLVVELPLPYALASAQRFAFGGVSLVNSMGCVDILAFGTESGRLEPLEQAVKAVDSPEVSEITKKYLDEGRTYAQARQLAVTDVFGEEVAQVITRPNNNLAVEYLRQLKNTHSNTIPLAMPRVVVEHDSLQSAAGFASASLLRDMMLKDGVKSVRPFVPQNAFSLYRRSTEEGIAPARLEMGERAVLAKLRSMHRKDLQRLPDLSEGLENRLAAAIAFCCSIEELYNAVKTKRYTLSRVRRLVLSAFLEVPGKLCLQLPPYLRVIGFNQRGAEILRRMKLEGNLPVSTSLSELRGTSPECREYALLEAYACDLYSLFLPQIRPCGMDYTEKFVLE